MIINWSNTDIIMKENTVIFSNRTTRKWIEIEERIYQFLIENYHYQQEVLIKKLYIEQNELPKDAVEFVDKMIEYGFLSNEITPEKRIVSLYITNKCNLFCKYCYRSASANNNGYFDASNINEVFDKLAIKFACKTLVVTGGEPLLHPNIYYILGQARKYFSSVILQTNGTLINDENIKCIKENVDRIRVGLDGSKAEVNDIIRGTGSFESIVEGIDCIRKNDIPLTISTTIYDSNINDMENITIFAENKGAEIIFTDFMPIGRGEGHIEKISINEKKNANKLSDIRCGAFSKKFAIDHEGYVYPCDELMNSDFLIGSIFELDENNVYNNHYVRNLINRNIYTLKKCTSCQYRYNCNALCPAQIYRDNGNISLTDVNCEQVHN